MTMTEIRDIRVARQDLQMTGTAVTFGLTYAARVYYPLAQALLNPKLLLDVADRLGSGDSIRLFYTSKGNRKDTTIHEMVDLVVRGFAGREPRLFQIGPVFRMQDDDKLAMGISPDVPGVTPLTFGEAEKLHATQRADAKPADPRDTLKIVERETSQGRGKPRLKSWDVYDGVGSALFSANEEEAARNFVRDFGKPAEG